MKKDRLRQIFVTHVINKDLHFLVYKEFLQNDKKVNKQKKKRAKGMNKHVTEEKFQIANNHVKVCF